MIARFSTLRSLLVAGTLGTVLVAALAFAQQTQEQPSAQPASPPPAPRGPKPAPSMQPQFPTVPGRPDIPNAELTKKLRGVRPPPSPTAPDKLPVAQLKLPKGFKVEVYASGIANARSLRLGDKGTLFVSNRVLDKVYAIGRALPGFEEAARPRDAPFETFLVLPMSRHPEIGVAMHGEGPDLHLYRYSLWTDHCRVQ